MYVRHLSLVDFRSYDAVELELGPGVTALVGPNGQGKTTFGGAWWLVSPSGRAITGGGSGGSGSGGSGGSGGGGRTGGEGTP